jgi:hypothetical protein
MRLATSKSAEASRSVAKQPDANAPTGQNLLMSKLNETNSR